MVHITNLHINKFRSLRDLELNELGSVNLFVGQNNSGKTSILESIELHCHPLNIGQLVTTSRSRDRFNFFPSRLPRIEYVRWLFPYTKDKDVITSREEISIFANVDDQLTHSTAFLYETKVFEPSEEIIILTEEDGTNIDEGNMEEVPGLEVKLGFKKSSIDTFNTLPYETKEFLITERNRISIRTETQLSLFPTRMVTPVDHRSLPISAKFISEVILSGDKPKILKLLKLFDEEIEGFELLNIGGREIIPYINHKTMGFSPVSIFGDGLRRALTLASALVRSENGILLIDEIETAFHAKLFEKVFAWLVMACKELNVQLFATTHSLEAIDAILVADKDVINEIVTFRIEYKKQKLRAKRFSGETLYELRHELGQDVR